MQYIIILLISVPRDAVRDPLARGIHKLLSLTILHSIFAILRGCSSSDQGSKSIISPLQIVQKVSKKAGAEL